MTVSTHRLAIAAAGVSLFAFTARADANPLWPDSLLGFEISAGAGVTGFSDSDSNDLFGTGGAWDLRIGLPTRSPISIEMAYVGMAQQIDGLVGTDNTLLGNGVEADLRLNLGLFLVQPSLFGGAGWMHYDVIGDDFPQLRALSSDDEVFTVPTGIGLSLRAVGAVFDVRGTYRFAFDDEILAADADDIDLDGEPQLDSWSALGRIGVEF
jgi:hypothetical protein